MRTNYKIVETQTFNKLALLKFSMLTVLPYQLQAISIEIDTQRVIQPGQLMLEGHLIREIIADEGVYCVDVF